MSNVPTNLIPTTVTGLPEYTGSSTLGYLPYVVDGRTYKVQFSNIAAVGAVPSSRTVATGTGLTGGGDLSANRTIAIANGGVGTAQLAASGVSAGVYGSGTLVPVLTVDATGRVTSATTAAVSVSGFVPTSRSVIAGTGLTGGGALTGDVTLNVNFSSSTPQALGTATAGVSTAAARGDHVHPAVNLADTSQTQGALPLGRGGTGDALSPVAGAVVYSTGTRFALSPLGLPGQVLMSDGANAPQWATVSGIGTVTSVNVSGGTTGLTFSGGPVTAAGTITMAGTLAVGNGGTGLTTLAANFVPKGNGTAAFSASQIFDNGTNVGIGTASPGTKLDVNGTTRSGNFRVNAGGTVTGAGMWGIDTILAFNTDSLERMRIDSVGRVGIGTATPASALNVAASDGFGLEVSPSNAGYVNLQSYNRTTSAFVPFSIASSFIAFQTNGTTERMRILSTGEVCVGRTNSLNTGVLSVLGTGTQAITTQVTVDGNSLIQGYNSSTGLAFQVLGTGQGYYAGNLGIGTTSPAARIHTNGGAGGINGVFESNTAADTRIEFRNNATRAGYLYWDANEVRLLADPTRAVTLFTNGVERMRVDNAGNVGIGTVSPTLQFQVGSRGGMSSSGVFQWGVALTGNNRGVLNWDTDRAIIGTPQNLVFCTNSETTERMRINSAGQVGIGTTNPAARLHVVNSAIADQFRLQDVLTDATIKYGVIGSGHYTNAEEPFLMAMGVSSATSNNLALGGGATSLNAATVITFFTAANITTTTGTERMRIVSSGEVGIGTSSPVARLTVGTGNFALTSLGAGSIGSTPATGTQKMVLGGNSATGVGNEIGWYPNTSFSGDTAQITSIATAFGVSSAGALLFRTNGGSETTPSERMRIKSTGQVRFVPLAAAPGSPEAGDVYYDSTTNKLRCYNGTTWNDLF